MTVDSIASTDMEDVAPQTLADKSAMPSSAASNGDVDMGISEEEEARLAIENLKGDDITERIAAANKLDIVAKVLGEERTRIVSSFFVRNVYAFVHCLYSCPLLRLH
jgi:hypothetical protein